MRGIAAWVLLLALVSQGEGKKPSRAIEILREDGKVVFREQGKPKEKGKPRAIPVVVGETIRWVNRDAERHRLRSVEQADGQPIFDTQSIKPGEFKDVVFDIDMYHKLGGRPAQYVNLRYRDEGAADSEGELTFISAARR